MSWACGRADREKPVSAIEQKEWKDFSAPTLYSAFHNLRGLALKNIFFVNYFLRQKI